MKNSLFLLSLMVLPSVALAGGAANLDLYNAHNNSGAATQNVEASANYGSSENPVSIIESRNSSGATINQNLLQYSFGYIPNSFWATYNGNLQDINGFVEIEEYFGETRRDQYISGEALEREDERQDRAQNKALRLRFIGQ